MPNSVNVKKEILLRYGIQTMDGTSDFIYFKNSKITIAYNTSSFIFYNTDFLIADVLKKFNLIDDMNTDTNKFEKFLKIKKEYLSKSKIKSLWKGDSFYLSKGNLLLDYSFDDYIDLEPAVFIADTKNKFNRLEAREVFSDERLTYEEYLDSIIATGSIGKKNNIVTNNSSNSSYNKSIYNKEFISDDKLSLKKQNIRNILLKKGILS